MWANATPEEQKCIDASTSIQQKLACLQDLIVTEITNLAPNPGIQFFELKFKQPVDHDEPTAGQFYQRLVLLHRGEVEPMVLQTSGYSIFSVNQASATALFETNQIQVEHRFFSDSRPEVLDWSKLNILQSAKDFHRITEAFKQIYPKAWVNTGGSKGGMTSIYHRRFFPADLDGTIADVAPLSFSTADERYIQFVDNVGGDAYKACRENFKKLQIEILKNRELLLPTIGGQYSRLGGADVALEHAVIEAPFVFWRYGNPDSPDSGCDGLPVDGTPHQLLRFMENNGAVSDYGDFTIASFLPYYFQAATQLGSPGGDTSYLQKLTLYPYNIDQYTPENVDYTYSNLAMQDIDTWARNEADHVLYIYGEFDPWSAGEFPVSETGKDVHKYRVPKGNHGSKFTKLPDAERAEAIELLTRWFNKAPVRHAHGFRAGQMLEDDDNRARRRHRLL